MFFLYIDYILKETFLWFFLKSLDLKKKNSFLRYPNQVFLTEASLSYIGVGNYFLFVFYDFYSS